MPAELRNQGSNLLDSRRSAHASIRGYLYQTCLGVLRWLDLQPNEVLLCEGDEDLDRFLLGGGAVSEQVKACTGGLSITDRVVRDSLRNFLRSYVTLRQRGETRQFVFITTAYEKKRRDGLDLDLLEAWEKGDRTAEVTQRVRSLVEPSKEDPNQNAIKEARTFLDQEDEGWKGFMDSVKWSFRAPELDLLRLEIEGKLQAERNVSSPRAILDHLVVHVLTTSSQKDADKRILTREILEAQISRFLADLARLAASPEALRIRTVFSEIDELRDLLDEGTRDLPEKPTPGQILTAAFEVLPFDEKGREEELDFLASWCESEDRRSVLLLTGEGGSGKTRLMLEWCRRLRHQGWHAGFLMRNRDEGDILPLLKGTAPRLVVVDYAETRLEVVEPLVEETGQAPQKEGPKLRVVLLARREADWWKNLSLLSGDAALLLSRSESRQIRPLIPHDLAARQQTFRNAVEGFAASLDRDIPKDLHLPDLSASQFDRALYLHMAALSTLQGERIETAEDALEQTLAHERRFWRGQVRGLSVNLHEQNALNKMIEMAVAVVTLVGGTADFPETYDLFGRTLRPRTMMPCSEGVVAEQLAILYQSSDQEEERYIDPLQPDLLGEEWVAKFLEQDEGLLARILDGASHKEAYSTLTVLTRIARRRPELQRWIGVALHGRLEQLAEIAIDVAVETGDPIGVELAREIEDSVSPEVVVRLQERCDAEKYLHSVPLREVALVATEKALSVLREQPSLNEDQQAELSRLASHLGNRLSDLGRREAALVAAKEAVEIRRKLAQQRPDAFLPVLALSLNNLGNRLRELGQREDALNTIEEAVKIRRTLAQQRPGAFLPGLSMSLNNLGIILSDLGRREDALDATKEAVEIRRKLVRQQPDAYLLVLAMSLNNLGNRFSEFGRRKDALGASQEAVEIYRQLATQRPDAFLPNLAMSLNNLSLRLSDLGQSEGALAVTQEAVEIYRRLARQRPHVFIPNFAMSLNNLGNRLGEFGRSEDAFRTTEEAVRVLTPLFLHLPAAFAPWMSKIVRNYLARAESAGKETDDAFLATLLEAFQSLSPSSQDPKA